MNLTTDLNAISTEQEYIDQLHTRDRLSTGVLQIFLDSGKDLPQLTTKTGSAKKAHLNPDPVCAFTVGNETKKSLVIQDTRDPVWGENFFFLLTQPQQQEIALEIRDKNIDRVIGSLHIPMSDILNTETMSMDQSFTIHNADNAAIKLKLRFRALKSAPKKVPEKESDDEIKPSGVAMPEAETDTNAAQTKKADAEASKVEELVAVRAEEVTAKSAPMTALSSALGADREVRHRVVPQKSRAMRILLKIHYNDDKEAASVMIVRAENLSHPDSGDSLPDAYCRAFLLPDRSTKRKTRVIEDKTNPEFNEKLDFPLKRDEWNDRTLELTIKHEGSKISKGKTIGEVFVKLHELDPTASDEQWFTIGKSTN